MTAGSTRASRAALLGVLLLSVAFAAAGAAPDADSRVEANAIFLVAKRSLADRNFFQSVVLVTQPERGKPFGVIINRPLDPQLSDVFPDHAALKTLKDKLYFGGPVARNALVFLVRSAKPPPRSTPVLRGVYFTGDGDWVDERLKRPDPLTGFRVFAGYSGWAPGQLEEEIERGDWYVLPADAATIFEKDPATIWSELVQRALLKRADRPSYPRS
jgi:putative transcriptional regulator